MFFKTRPERTFLHYLSAPFIYSMIIPGVVIDIWISLYHWVCFPLYGIEYVDRKKYIKIDRHKLSYLDWLAKINCVYCGYMNGLFAYITEIGAQTENYWCGIKHEEDGYFVSPPHHERFNFVDYNDEEAYHKRYYQKTDSITNDKTKK